MLSAVKNFAITLIVSLLVFGTIAFFVAPAIEQGMTMGGKSTESTDGSGESKLPDGYVYVTDDSGATVTDANGNPITEPAPTNGEDVKGKSFNILLLGNDYQPDVLTDYNLSGKNAEIDGFKIKERTINVDTIILIRVDKEKGQFIFLTIPSNTQVYVSGGNTTLSALYSKYGLDYLCQKVRALTGLNTDYYVSMSIPNLVSALGAIGDISYMVPTDMYYKDEEQSLTINLKKGQQTLTPEQALQLLRYNSYPDGNISRMATGVDFLKAVLDKLSSDSYKEKAQSVYNSVIGYADTNFTVDDLQNNIELLFSYPKFEKVNISYPGVTKSENSTYYFVPSYTDAIESRRKYR